ncbi:MAG: pilus assembly PilX N-terminal domain-containing protein [Arenicellales bacterium]|jgi:hypothetical protein|nr:pilus assembly PilX N-terminal domain-containing protein [Arenicellales bacterium]|tara:strand:+ start:1201 stop:1758 length:558 start_codon:yes stop_codon:yes gene_type:complete
MVIMNGNSLSIHPSAQLPIRQEGAVLVVTLLITAVMSLIGVALFQRVGSDIQIVERATARTETFYAADSCVEDAKNYILGNSGPWGGVLATPQGRDLPRRNMTFLYNPATEGAKVRDRLSQFSYTCNLKQFDKTLVNPDAGETIEMTFGYQQQGTLRKQFYHINGSGFGPGGARREIEAVLSWVR